MGIFNWNKKEETNDFLDSFNIEIDYNKSRDLDVKSKCFFINNIKNLELVEDDNEIVINLILYYLEYIPYYITISYSGKTNIIKKLDKWIKIYKSNVESLHFKYDYLYLKNDDLNIYKEELEYYKNKIIIGNELIKNIKSIIYNEDNLINYKDEIILLLKNKLRKLNIENIY